MARVPKQRGFGGILRVFRTIVAEATFLRAWLVHLVVAASEPRATNIAELLTPLHH